MPWAFKPLRKKMAVRQIPSQLNIPETELMLENHPKTLDDPELTPMNDNNASRVETPMAYTGVPCLLTYPKILGACPVLAKPYKARDEVYMSEDPADQADVKKAALTIEGKALIPEIRIAMTQAELAAVPVPVVRSGLLDGQMRPRMNTPAM